MEPTSRHSCSLLAGPALLPSASTDRRLQDLKREAASGDPEAACRLESERNRLEEWQAGSREGEPYRESLLRELEGLTFLDVTRYE